MNTSITKTSNEYSNFQRHFSAAILAVVLILFNFVGSLNAQASTEVTHNFSHVPDHAIDGAQGAKISTSATYAVPTEQLGDSLSCLEAYNLGDEFVRDGDYRVGRDTLEAFVEHCYDQPYSWRAFGDINGAVSGISEQPEWLAFRNWLFKVLYLNLDSQYYCGDVDMLAATFNYVLGPRGDDMKGKIAVENYMIESGKCPMFVASERYYISLHWRTIYTKWLDTVKDSLATPFDSTLPTLQQIGFEILLGPQNGFVKFDALPRTVLGEISAMPNPFDAEEKIRYTLNVPATLTVEVFDLLGKKVSTLVPGVMTLNGDGTLTLSGLNPGSYYVRFSVPEGEVRTLRVVRQ